MLICMLDVRQATMVSFCKITGCVGVINERRNQVRTKSGKNYYNVGRWKFSEMYQRLASRQGYNKGS